VAAVTIAGGSRWAQVYAKEKRKYAKPRENALFRAANDAFCRQAVPDATLSDAFFMPCYHRRMQEAEQIERSAHVAGRGRDPRASFASRSARFLRIGIGSLGRIAAVAWLAIASLFAASLANAQSYPSRPIRVVVPFSPGGAVDGPMRVIAQELAKRLGQQVVIDNRPGAGATIGSEIVAKSPPDGYTLLLASQTNAISATLYSKLTFDPVDDFVAVSLIGREPGVVVVHPSLPVHTLQELVAYAKARPGRIDYASSGNGSGQHLFMAMLASMTGMQLTHVPYKGSGQATADLLGGQVLVSIPGTAGMVGHIKAGKLRALAVTGTTRSPQLPDVPTVAEAGVPGYAAYVWMGLLAPRGTPPAIIERLNGALKDTLASDDVRQHMTSAGIEVVGSTPDEFTAFFRAERDRWAKVIRETGAKAD
jgi:tripartite-type tricarboxylate transporter receptor subunit TctC